MIGKPITDNMKQKANALYSLLFHSERAMTKSEIGVALGIGNERSVRDVVSVLSHKRPIISTSDNKGYRMAKNENDLEEVIHTWQEIDSRIAELEERKKPLIEFYEKYRR